jgi:MOSC domain-containing protein YiiM
LELVAEQGIKEDRRYFGRVNSAGRPSRRQVTLIEREQIAEHAAALGLESIAPGAVRSNIETTGIDLQALMGREVQVGGARLRFYEPRKPCAKMDAICQGLRELMEKNRQGALAEVVQSGVVRVGDPIRAT